MGVVFWDQIYGSGWNFRNRDFRKSIMIGSISGSFFWTRYMGVALILYTLFIVLNNSISLFLLIRRYFVVALSVACFYSIISTLATLSAFKKPSSCSAILLLNLAIMDAVIPLY